MKYIIEIDTEEPREAIESFISVFACKVLSVKKKPVQRTDVQNSSIHLWCQQQADHWNESGYDMMTVLEKAVPMKWTKETVKETIWRKVQKAIIHKESTTNLDTKEVSEVYDQINSGLSGNKIPVVAFPSREELIHKQRT